MQTTTDHLITRVTPAQEDAWGGMQYPGTMTAADAKAAVEAANELAALQKIFEAENEILQPVEILHV